MPVDEKEKVIRRLIDSFQRWENLLHQGGQDPFATDGIDMNLVRNHIIADKQQIEKLFTDKKPDIYLRPTPDVMPDTYMAKAEEIWYGAIEILRGCRTDENRRYLKNLILTDEIKMQSGLSNLQNDESQLEIEIEAKNYVELRRFLYKNFKEGYRLCRQEVNRMCAEREQKQEQLDLFTMQIKRRY